MIQNNSDEEYIIDQEIADEFVDESEESLSAILPLVVKLESGTGDPELINAIFRPIHSIKGNSAYFRLMAVNRLSHELESLLDILRKGQVPPSSIIVSAIISGINELQNIFSRVREGAPEIVDPDNFERIIAMITEVADSSKTEAAQLWGRLEKGLQLLESKCNSTVVPIINDLNKNIRVLKHMQCGEGSNFAGGRKPVSALDESVSTESISDALDEIRLILAKPLDKEVLPRAECERVKLQLERLQSELKESPTASAIASAAIDAYETVAGAVGFDQLLGDILLEKCDEIQKCLGLSVNNKINRYVPPPPANSETNDKTPPGSDGLQNKTNGRVSKTMRVSEQRIDEFLNYVGELVIVGEMFDYMNRRLHHEENNSDSSIASDFNKANENFTILSRNLQKSIMEIRKIPLRIVFQKIPQIVREVAATSGKEISLEISGEDIKVDKSLIDALESPLTHMVRNAVDHGIEPPEERLSKGKPPKGYICISVEEGEDVKIKIQDDGKGLNFEKLREKAKQMGIPNMVEDDVSQLLFVPGLSTAKKVTKISGRGVGMDIAKREISKVGGKIDVQSVSHSGTTFNIHLPTSVCVKIVDGLVVRIGNERFVLPLAKVKDMWSLESRYARSCVLRQGKMISLVRICDLLEIKKASNSRVVNEMVVSVEVDEGSCSQSKAIGFVVEEIIGIQRVVLKEIMELQYSSEKLFSGGAILGDGKVAMVINVNNCLAFKNSAVTDREVVC